MKIKYFLLIVIMISLNSCSCQINEQNSSEKNKSENEEIEVEINNLSSVIGKSRPVIVEKEENSSEVAEPEKSAIIENEIIALSAIESIDYTESRDYTVPSPYFSDSDENEGESFLIP